MIALDTSSLRRFLAGEEGPDVDAVAAALDAQTAVLPPVVLTEILSDAAASRQTAEALANIPLLEPTLGYWFRAGRLRGAVIAAGHKAKVADALIAQSCLDHDVPLITHDRDFRHYAEHGLMLLL